MLARIVCNMLILLCFYIVANAEDFKPSFNTGLSKMEMIEKMDKYLSQDLAKELNSRNEQFNNFQIQYKEEMAQLKKSLENINKKLSSIEGSMSADKLNTSNSDNKDNDLNYLKDLKKVIIPAIQKKILENEASLQDLIKNLMAIKNVEKQIEEGTKNE